jgi:hypothetical protein
LGWVDPEELVEEDEAETSENDAVQES